MNALIVAEESVMTKIYYVRKQKIMLDKDLAALYGVQPIRLREQVKRNMKRFPANFMFQLTGREAAKMVSQNAIPSNKQLGGFLPYAFTEHGVLMLAAVLRSDKAMQAKHPHYRNFCKDARNADGRSKHTGANAKSRRKINCAR